MFESNDAVAFMQLLGPESEMPLAWQSTAIGLIALVIAMLALAIARILSVRRDRRNAKRMVDAMRLRATLAELARSLNADELAVLRWIATRLIGGRAQYGELRLNSDTRRFTDEAANEAVDALAYLAMASLKPSTTVAKGSRVSR